MSHDRVLADCHFRDTLLGRRPLRVLSLLLVLAFFVSACEGFQLAEGLSKIPPEDELPAEVVRGLQLYKTHCASCHPETAKDSKYRGSSASVIRDSINAIPQMASLKSLTGEEVSDIAAALNYNFGGGGQDPQLLKSAIVAPLATRRLIASHIRYIFKTRPDSTDGDDGLVETKITNHVFNRVGEWGGPCFRSERETTAICGNEAAGAGANVLPLSNTLRSGWQARICNEILERSSVVATMLSKAGLTETSAVTVANVRALFDVFFPGQETTAEIEAAAMALGRRAGDLGYTPATAWQLMGVEMCNSPLLEQL